MTILTVTLMIMKTMNAPLMEHDFNIAWLIISHSSICTSILITRPDLHDEPERWHLWLTNTELTERVSTCGIIVTEIRLIPYSKYKCTALTNTYATYKQMMP